MPVYKMEEAQTFGVFPPDTIIQVEVLDVQERFVEGKNGNPGWNKLEFKFNVVGMPDSLEPDLQALKGSFIWGSVSAKFTDHVDNKLRQWTEALLGVSVNEPGFELNTDILIGRKARAITSQYPRKDNTFQHQVAALLPVVGSSSTAPTSSPTTSNTFASPAAQALQQAAFSSPTLDEAPF